MATNNPNPNPNQNNIRQQALDTASVVEQALRSIADNITSTFEQVMGGFDDVSQSTAKDIQSRFNKMAKFTDDIASNIVKLKQGNLDVKKVHDQIVERQTKQEALGIQLVTLMKQQGHAAKNIDELIQKMNAGTISLTNEEKKLVEEYNRVVDINKIYTDQLQDQISKQEEINRKLGVTGKLIKGMSKIPIIGNLIDTDKAMAAANKEIDKGGGKFKAMGAAVKSAGADIVEGIKDPLTGIVFLAKQFIDAFKLADKGTGELAKSMNMTYSQANELRQELTGMSEDVNVNTKGLQESLIAVGKSLGSNAILNEKDLVTFTKLREMAGFTNEELASMEKYTLATGGNLEDNVKNLMYAAKTTALNNGVMLNEKDIMRDIAKASNAVKLSIAGGVKELGKAAAEAKSFGMNLDQVDKIAGGLMDFESSISAELEAQLLTGKNINLEQARLYALNNDYAGLSREIAKNIGTAADFSKMNRLQQEAIAKAVGMSREELASTLTDQAALKGLSGEQAEKAKAALSAARARGMTEEQIAQTGINDLMKQQDLQERLTKSTEKLKEVFVGIAEAIMPILDTLSVVLQVIGYVVKPLTFILSAFGSLNEMVSGLGTALKGLAGILMMVGIAALYVNGSLTLGLGIAAALAAIGLGMTAMKRDVTSVQDAQINPDGGLMVSGNKGTYSLDKNDTVIAGTGLNKSKSQNQQISNDAAVKELQEIKSILKRTLDVDMQMLTRANAAAALNGGGSALNTDKFGTIVGTNTYKTQ